MAIIFGGRPHFLCRMTAFCATHPWVRPRRIIAPRSSNTIGMGCSRYVSYISIDFQHLCACSIFFHYTSLRFSQAFPTCFDDGSVSNDTAQPTTPSPSIVSSSLFAHRARARRGVRRSTPDSGIQRDGRDGLIDGIFCGW